MMADTEATFVGTDKYYQVYGQKEPTGAASDVESLWNNEIKSNGNYEISIGTESGVDVNQTSSTCDALADVRGNQIVQTELNYYDKDAVVVIDARSYSGSGGCAYVDVAGTDYAVGYVSPADPGTAAHELGHVYGAEHSDFENFGWFSYTLMENGAKSCNNNNPQTIREMTYSSCSQSTIRGSSVF